MFEVGGLPSNQLRTKVAPPGLCQFQQGRHRENSASDIGAHRLTQPVRVTDQIEDIVNELERHSEILSKLAELLTASFGSAAQSAPTRHEQAKSAAVFASMVKRYRSIS